MSSCSVEVSQIFHCLRMSHSPWVQGFPKQDSIFPPSLEQQDYFLFNFVRLEGIHLNFKILLLITKIKLYHRYIFHQNFPIFLLKGCSELVVHSNDNIFFALINLLHSLRAPESYSKSPKYFLKLVAASHTSWCLLAEKFFSFFFFSSDFR